MSDPTTQVLNPEAALLNGVPVDQLVETVRAVQGEPKIAQFTFRARNEWDDGARNTARFVQFDGACQTFHEDAPHAVSMDEAPVLLGTDTAGNPVEVLLAALSGCLTTSLVYHAAALGIEVSAVRSTYEGDLDLHGFLGLNDEVRNGYAGIDVRFEIESPSATEEQLDQLLQIAQDRSPVFDVVKNGCPVRVSRA